MAAYSCIHFNFVKLVGSIFSDKVRIGTRRKDRIIFDESEVISKKIEGSVMEFMEELKTSDGIDFVIINTSIFILLSRQEKGFNIFTTNSSDYIKIFTDPKKYFDFNVKSVNYYTTLFSLECYEIFNKKDETFLSKIINRNDSREVEDLIVEKIKIPRTQEEFYLFCNQNDIIKHIKLGKFIEDEVVFDQYPLQSETISLEEIISNFSKTKYDILELSGKTKIVGVANEDRSITWFTEFINDTSIEESDYINEMSRIFTSGVEEVSDAE